MSAIQKKETLHDAISATATGSSVEVGGMETVTAQVTGTFVASVTWQGSIDGSNWVDLLGMSMDGGAVSASPTAPGIYKIPVGGLLFFRANVAWTSGTSVTVTIIVSRDVEPGLAAILSFAPSKVAEVTLSLDTAQYASGDVLAATQIIEACMRGNGGTGVIHSVVLLDKNDQGGALDLVFFRTNASIGNENDAVSVSDANADEILGIVEITAGDYVDLVNSQLVTKTSVGIVVDADAGADDLYVAAISRDTKTYTAAGITLKIGFLRD